MAKSVGYEALAVSSAAVAPTLSTVSAANKSLVSYALVRVESNDVRWRDDGTNPTASVGFPLFAKDVMRYADPAKMLAGSLLFIRQSADATVHFEYFIA